MPRSNVKVKLRHSLTWLTNDIRLLSIISVSSLTSSLLCSYVFFLIFVINGKFPFILELISFTLSYRPKATSRTHHFEIPFFFSMGLALFHFLRVLIYRSAYLDVALFGLSVSYCCLGFLLALCKPDVTARYDIEFSALSCYKLFLDF